MHKYVSISVIILAMLSNIFAAPKKKPKKQVATSSSAAVDPHPLHTAARAGDIEQVQSLVEQQPSIIDSRDNNGRTPIMEAAANGRFVVVEYLAQQEAALELHDNGGKTALLLAAANGHLESAKRLMEALLALDRLDELTVLHAHAVAWRNRHFTAGISLGHYYKTINTYSKAIKKALLDKLSEEIIAYIIAQVKEQKCSLM